MLTRPNALLRAVASHRSGTLARHAPDIARVAASAQKIRNGRGAAEGRNFDRGIQPHFRETVAQLQRRSCCHVELNRFAVVVLGLK